MIRTASYVRDASCARAESQIGETSASDAGTGRTVGQHLHVLRQASGVRLQAVQSCPRILRA